MNRNQWIAVSAARLIIGDRLLCEIDRRCLGKASSQPAVAGYLARSHSMFSR